MLKDKIEKVLEEYALRVDSGEYVDDNEKLCLKCLIAVTKEFTTRILELVEKCVPEEKPYHEESPRMSESENNGLRMWDNGFNQAIAEITQRIGVPNETQ